MKYSGHRKIICEISKFSKFNTFICLGYYTNTNACIYTCLQIPPRENWFQYVPRVYAAAINFPCIITLLYRTCKFPIQLPPPFSSTKPFLVGLKTLMRENTLIFILRQHGIMAWSRKLILRLKRLEKDSLITLVGSAFLCRHKGSKLCGLSNV